MIPTLSRWLLPPAILLAALAAYRACCVRTEAPRIKPPRNTPWVIAPTQNDPRIVTDEQLADLLDKLQPPADPINTNNIVHALRLWGPEAAFDDPRIPSGQQMRDYLLDDQVFQQWAGPVPPLYQRTARGVDVRTFDDDFEHRTTGSYHLDDLLATLAESGVPLDTRMMLREGEATVEELLDTSLRRFHLQQLEYEWSIITYIRYAFPLRDWKNRYGEKIDLDGMIKELVRHPIGRGPCRGLHRYEAIVLLLKVDEQEPTLKPAVRAALVAYLKKASQLLVASQAVEGWWSGEWINGVSPSSEAVKRQDEQILVTGHHLEWLALAPEEALPPRETLVRAGQWMARTLSELDPKTLVERYGPYSHAARALCLWRSQEPYAAWRKLHPAKVVSNLSLTTDH